jgi:hypothetical protein
VVTNIEGAMLILGGVIAGPLLPTIMNG